MSIKVIINGANGRMGQEAVKAVEAANDLSLVGQAGKSDNLLQLIQTTNADVVVDLTVASSAFANTKTILSAGAYPVVGTSGLMENDIVELKAIAKQHNLGGIIAPNFSIGAVLAMCFAKQAAKYLPHVEIIEMHHDKKQDAPSGTAIRTADMIAEGRRETVKAHQAEKETVSGSRGALYQDIPIHAVRLPGLLAHEQIIFGSTGETLTLKTDALNRSCFMPGIILACQKVQTLDELVVGLEHLLD